MGSGGRGKGKGGRGKGKGGRGKGKGERASNELFFEDFRERLNLWIDSKNPSKIPLSPFPFPLSPLLPTPHSPLPQPTVDKPGLERLVAGGFGQIAGRQRHLQRCPFGLLRRRQSCGHRHPGRLDGLVAG